MIDLRGMMTESRNPESMNLDEMTALEIVTVMNSEDIKVPQAIKSQLPMIAQAVNCCVSGIKEGGRIIYIGAGTSGRLGIVDASECPPTFGVSHDLVVGLMAGGMSNSGAYIIVLAGVAAICLIAGIIALLIKKPKTAEAAEQK